MPTRLTEAQIGAFHRDGFVAPVDVMSDQEAGRLRAQLETAERNHPDRLSAANRNNAHYEFRFLDAIRDHHDTFHEDNILTRGQTIHEVDHDRTVPIEPCAGQMSLHHVRTVHASGANQSGDRRIGVVLQAFSPPQARQTHGHDFALLVCGEDRHHHFRPGCRPRADAEPEGVAFRKNANDRFAEILYAGAARQRGL